MSLGIFEANILNIFEIKKMGHGYSEPNLLRASPYSLTVLWTAFLIISSLLLEFDLFWGKPFFIKFFNIFIIKIVYNKLKNKAKTGK